MRRNEAMKAVIGELRRHNIPWQVEDGGRHPIVRYLGHAQVVTGSKARTSTIANALAHTRRIIRQYKAQSA
jgi:hypothetical protein